MTVVVKEEYSIHKKTGVVIRKGTAFSLADVEPYTPPKYLRKVDGTNKGKLFPWTFHMSQRKDMMPYNGDPENLPELPEKIKANTGKVTTDGLQPMPVPDNPNDLDVPKSDDNDEDPEVLGILDQLCKQNGTTREQEIINSFSRLDPKKDFGGNGRPLMSAIYRELGDEDIGYQEMLTAWKNANEAKAA